MSRREILIVMMRGLLETMQRLQSIRPWGLRAPKRYPTARAAWLCGRQCLHPKFRIISQLCAARLCGRQCLLFAIAAALFCAVMTATAAQALYAASEHVAFICSELERRSSRGELRRVMDMSAGVNVWYDQQAYDHVYRQLGDEAFAQWCRSLPPDVLEGFDMSGAVAIVLTAQRSDVVLSPKSGVRKFGFLEAEGVVLMGEGCMIICEDPWRTRGRPFSNVVRVEYESANISDEGETFICGSRRYRNIAFAGLLLDMKRARSQNE